MQIGYDHLDISMIRSKNVRVSNAPAVEAIDATAEQAISLMLAAARNTLTGAKFSKELTKSTFNHLGQQFSGSTLGIIGMGRIGKKIAEMAGGFRCRILYHNRSKMSDDYAHNGIFWVTSHLGYIPLQPYQSSRLFFLLYKCTFSRRANDSIYG